MLRGQVGVVTNSLAAAGGERQLAAKSSSRGRAERAERAFVLGAQAGTLQTKMGHRHTRLVLMGAVNGQAMERESLSIVRGAVVVTPPALLCVYSNSSRERRCARVSVL